MRKSTIEATFQSDIQDVWNIITNVQDCTWRSDLESIEVIDDCHFKEYIKGGYVTEFYITKKQAMKYYAFDMVNKNWKGQWTGEFKSSKQGETTVVFTEIIQIHNPIMELLSYVFMPISKIQKQYITDLKVKLDENTRNV